MNHLLHVPMCMCARACTSGVSTSLSQKSTGTAGFGEPPTSSCLATCPNSCCWPVGISRSTFIIHQQDICDLALSVLTAEYIKTDELPLVAGCRIDPKAHSPSNVKVNFLQIFLFYVNMSFSFSGIDRLDRDLTIGQMQGETLIQQRITAVIQFCI